jgi:hypothetical protein
MPFCKGDPLLHGAITAAGGPFRKKNLIGQGEDIE